MAVVTICNDFEAPHPPKKIKSATASTVSPSIWQNAGVVSCSLLQDIFPTQGSNPCLPHCRWILYQLSQHFGSPKILEWVAYPFSRGSSWPRNRTWVSCIAGRFFTSWATMEASSSVIVCLFFFFSSLNAYHLEIAVLSIILLLPIYTSQICIFYPFSFLQLPSVTLSFPTDTSGSACSQAYIWLFLFPAH